MATAGQPPNTDAPGGECWREAKGKFFSSWLHDYGYLSITVYVVFGLQDILTDIV